MEPVQVEETAEELDSLAKEDVHVQRHHVADLDTVRRESVRELPAFGPVEESDILGGEGGGEAWVSQVLPPSRPPSAPPYLLEEGLEESVTETADDASASEAEAEAAYARAQGGKDA